MLELKSVSFPLTDAIKFNVNTMVQELEDLLSESQSVHVTLSKDSPEVFKVHMQTIVHGKAVISEQTSHDFQKALEICRDNFEKNIRKTLDAFKDKRK